MASSDLVQPGSDDGQRRDPRACRPAQLGVRNDKQVFVHGVVRGQV